METEPESCPGSSQPLLGSSWMWGLLPVLPGFLGSRFLQNILEYSREVAIPWALDSAKLIASKSVCLGKVCSVHRGCMPL